MLSPTLGRVLSAVGAIVVAVALALTWYHIDRSALEGTTDTTGWQTFPRLRVIILVGAVAVLVTALVRQVRPVVVARTLLGLVLAALILRRIVDPPDLSAPVSAQIGVYVGLFAALCVALGGLVDTGREVVAAHPGLALWRPPAGELGPGSGGGGPRRPAAPPAAPGGDVVDGTSEELRASR